MLTSLLAAKRNGATIIDINPLPEVGLLRFKHPQEPMHLLAQEPGFRIVFCRFASTAMWLCSKE